MDTVIVVGITVVGLGAVVGILALVVKRADSPQRHARRFATAPRPGIAFVILKPASGSSGPDEGSEPASDHYISIHVSARAEPGQQARLTRALEDVEDGHRSATLLEAIIRKTVRAWARDKNLDELTALSAGAPPPDLEQSFGEALRDVGLRAEELAVIGSVPLTEEHENLWRHGVMQTFFRDPHSYYRIQANALDVYLDAKSGAGNYQVGSWPLGGGAEADRPSREVVDSDALTVLAGPRDDAIRHRWVFNDLKSGKNRLKSAADRCALPEPLDPEHP